ncbi:hypothetical protein GCM10023322_58860 [Rugosimonospora acidiphila]|uniref:Acyl-CoA carboxylase subunit epsilon n=1 Tax=Rugosimonospora acidiphila TaxID=556531 RepID=A0ABP9SD94_9ACTN
MPGPAGEVNPADEAVPADAETRVRLAAVAMTAAARKVRPKIIDCLRVAVGWPTPAAARRGSRVRRPGWIRRGDDR